MKIYNMHIVKTKHESEAWADGSVLLLIGPVSK